MARSRNIKPSFFENEYLAELPAYARLLFIGIWTLADAEGRLQDRPKKIKGQIFPYEDVDVDNLLDQLAQKPGNFIARYEVNGDRYIQVLNFTKHQNPHKREKEAGSEFPKMPELSQPFPGQVQTLPEPAGRIPDSLLLIPDSLTTSTQQSEKISEGGGSGILFEMDLRGQTMREDEWVYRNLMEHRRSKGLKSQGAVDLQSLLTLYPTHLNEWKRWATLPLAKRIAGFAFAAIKAKPDNHFRYASTMAESGTGEDFDKYVARAQAQIDQKDYFVRIA